MEPTRPAVDLPVEGQLPSLSGPSGWLNSSPLTAAGAVRVRPDRPVESAASLALPRESWLVAYCA